MVCQIGDAQTVHSSDIVLQLFLEKRHDNYTSDLMLSKYYCINKMIRICLPSAYFGLKKEAFVFREQFQ